MTTNYVTDAVHIYMHYVWRPCVYAIALVLNKGRYMLHVSLQRNYNAII